jgi:hypothetical protein
MRPQNAILEIMDTIEPVGQKQRNGIYFFEQGSQLQLASFKNSRFFGERILDLPSSLDKKLRAYLQFVRPIFGNFIFLFLFLLLILYDFHR